MDGDGYGDNPNGTMPDHFPTDASQWLDSDGDGFGDNYTWSINSQTGLRDQLGDDSLMILHNGLMLMEMATVTIPQAMMPTSIHTILHSGQTQMVTDSLIITHTQPPINRIERYANW